MPEADLFYSLARGSITRTVIIDDPRLASLGMGTTNTTAADTEIGRKYCGGSMYGGWLDTAMKLVGIRRYEAQAGREISTRCVEQRGISFDRRLEDEKWYGIFGFHTTILSN
jgi:hypothetical protein